DKKMILKAVEATLDGKKQPLADNAYNELLMEVNTALIMKQREKQQQLESQTREQEETYFKQLLAENPNLKAAKEGFYYEVLQEGKGRRAEKGSLVTFDYRSLFTNGQVFDQTYGNREPIRKVVGNPMFQGLQEAFTYMNAGSKYRFYFPSEKAFGPEGTEGIPPYTTMIYEVEVHKVE
ncbi:MAG: FKBP-type peptidyl-prolyl cis-trans isomerase, partial [Bacteroidales bacterium]|nr:FKBP-type peptidyl-prolyl cis-trans isomerase [Bacteroidales bacterium]